MHVFLEGQLCLNKLLYALCTVFVDSNFQKLLYSKSKCSNCCIHVQQPIPIYVPQKDVPAFSYLVKYVSLESAEFSFLYLKCFIAISWICTFPYSVAKCLDIKLECDAMLERSPKMQGRPKK